MWFRSVITPYELRTDNQMNGTKEITTKNRLKLEKTGAQGLIVRPLASS